MKKRYIEPSQIACNLVCERVISTSTTSDRIISSGATEDIHYGGIDEDGSLDPSAKALRNIWDEEW